MNAINTGDPTLEHQVAAWRQDPFDPDAIAQMRPVAYQRAIVMEDCGPPGSLMQVGNPNRRKLRRLRAGVVSVTEKADLLDQLHHMAGKQHGRARAGQAGQQPADHVGGDRVHALCARLACRVRYPAGYRSGAGRESRAHRWRMSGIGAGARLGPCRACPGLAVKRG
jgi:hypothetical protein